MLGQIVALKLDAARRRGARFPFAAARKLLAAAAVAAARSSAIERQVSVSLSQLEAIRATSLCVSLAIRGNSRQLETSLSRALAGAVLEDGGDDDGSGGDDVQRHRAVEA